MTSLVYILMRLINGLVTMYLALPLYSIYRRTTRRFYFYWSTGFVLYGASIILRITSIDTRTPTPLSMVAYALLLAGLTMIIAGIGDLVNRLRAILLSALVLPAILGAMMVLGREWTDFGLFVALAPYVFIAASLVVIKFVWKPDINLLIAGWVNIMLLNVGYIYQLMNEGFVDFAMTFTKIFIYLGMTAPGFSFLVDDLTRFLIGGMPDEYVEKPRGIFTLVTLQDPQRDKEVRWIRERTHGNKRKGVRTVLVILYDMIMPTDIGDEQAENLYFVRVIQGGRGSLNTFEERIMVMNDDPNQLDILFTDIINFSKNNYVPCEILLYNLSQMILTHGWRRVYSFLISNLSQLKSSNVNFTCFYYPETHENPADIKIFERMADAIVTQ